MKTMGAGLPCEASRMSHTSHMWWLGWHKSATHMSLLVLLYLLGTVVAKVVVLDEVSLGALSKDNDVVHVHQIKVQLSGKDNVDIGVQALKLCGCQCAALYSVSAPRIAVARLPKRVCVYYLFLASSRDGLAHVSLANVKVGVHVTRLSQCLCNRSTGQQVEGDSRM